MTINICQLFIFLGLLNIIPWVSFDGSSQAEKPQLSFFISFSNTKKMLFLVFFHFPVKSLYRMKERYISCFRAEERQFAHIRMTTEQNEDTSLSGVQNKFSKV